VSDGTEAAGVARPAAASSLVTDACGYLESSSAAALR